MIKKATTKKKLTAAEKRVAIAEDTIKWLNSRAIKATPGTYFGAPAKGIKVKSHDDKLDVALKKTKEACKVCALGGLFYSMVRRFDKVTVGVGNIDSRLNSDYFLGVDGFGVFEELEKYFPHQQLAAIESAFEQRDMFEYEDHAKMSDAEMVWSQDFTRGAKTPADRLRAIMNNIIENKGKFRP